MVYLVFVIMIVQAPQHMVQGNLPKMTRREFSIFIIYSDTYTCSYAV